MPGRECRASRPACRAARAPTRRRSSITPMFGACCCRCGRRRSEAARDLIAEMRASLAALDAPGLAPLRQPLASGIDALDQATAHLVAADPAAAAAGSVPYLQLFGTVLGGWLIARVVAVAL